MQSRNQFPNLFFNILSPAATAALAIAILVALTVLQGQSAQAQTGVIYNFTGGVDGAYPSSGLTTDGAGNLYGTTCGQVCGSGTNSYGSVFQLTKHGSSWVFTPLYNFQGGADGSAPMSRVIIGPGGALYGTTMSGGTDGECYFWISPGGCGTVFKLTPPYHVAPNAVGGSKDSPAAGGWTKSVLYQFSGGADGGNPFVGDLIFDEAGNLYGTTAGGGSIGAGTVYELTPTSGGWTETVLYSFGANGEGNPLGGVVFDGSGNLYLSAFYGGEQSGGLNGAIFQLTPSGSSWTENLLYGFQGSGDGANPIGGVTFDQHGNLFGTTSEDGYYNPAGGTAFMLDGSAGWSFSLLYNFPGPNSQWGWPQGPWASLTATDGADGEKNFYGTTTADGSYGSGSIFSLTYNSYGQWQYSSLWSFGELQNDGAYPISGLAFGVNDGYAYLTTQGGGTHGVGTVFRVSP